MDQSQPFTNLYNEMASLHYALTGLFADFTPSGKSKLIKSRFFRSASINKWGYSTGQKDEMPLQFKEISLEYI
jgi:hypothetical protein